MELKKRLQLCLCTLFLGIGGKTTTEIASEGVKGAQMLVLGSKIVKISNFTHSYDVICQNLGKVGKKLLSKYSNNCFEQPLL